MLSLSTVVVSCCVLHVSSSVRRFYSHFLSLIFSHRLIISCIAFRCIISVCLRPGTPLHSLLFTSFHFSHFFSVSLFFCFCRVNLSLLVFISHPAFASAPALALALCSRHFRPSSLFSRHSVPSVSDLFCLFPSHPIPRLNHTKPLSLFFSVFCVCLLLPRYCLFASVFRVFLSPN